MARGNAKISHYGGFTIIELMVVVSIIVLLLALLIPTLGQARRVANTPRCLVAVRGGGMLAAVYANDHKNYIPSHVGWSTPGNGSWPVFDQRYDPSLDGQDGGHTNSDWMRMPYSSFLTWNNTWRCENKRPINWGILVADGYVNDVRNTLFCPSRGYVSYYTAHPYPNQRMNQQSYQSEWVKAGQPTNNASINLNIVSDSSYNVYSYGTLDRVYCSNGANWFQQDVRPNQFVMAFETNGYVEVDPSNYGGPKTFIGGLGPFANNHQPGITTLFFDNHAKLVADPSDNVETLPCRPDYLYNWLWTQLSGSGTSAPHDGDFTAQAGWTPCANPGLSAVDNAAYYQPRYDANIQNNIYGQ